MSVRESSEKPDLTLMGYLQSACRYQLDRKEPKLALSYANDLVCYAESTCRTAQPLSLVFAYRLLAEVRLTLQDAVRARSLLEKALGVLREAKRERCFDAILVWQLLAQVQARGGDYEASLATMGEVAQLQAKVLGEKHPDYHRTIEEQRKLRICALLIHGRLETAETDAILLLEEFQRTYPPTNAKSLAGVYLIRARVARARSRLAEMEKFARQALKKLEEGHEDRSLPGLQALRIILGYRTDSIKRSGCGGQDWLPEEKRSYLNLQLRVMELQQELLGSGDPACARTLRDTLHRSKAWHLPVADSSQLREAIARQFDRSPPRLPTETHVRLAEGDPSGNTGTTESARLDWILEKIDDPDPTATTLAQTQTVPIVDQERIRRSLEEDRAEAARKRKEGACEDAFDLLAQACLRCDALIARQVFALPDRMQWLKTLAFVEELQADLLTVLADLGFSGPVRRETALDLILHGKGLAAETMLTQQLTILSGRYPELSTELRKLELLRQAIVHKTLNGPDQGFSPEKHHETLKDWHLERASLEHCLALLIPEMNLEEQLKPVSSCSVSKHLPKDTILVEFIRYRPTALTSQDSPQNARYLAFLLHGGATAERVFTVDLGEASIIDDLIFSFRQSLVPGRPSHDRPLVLIDVGGEPTIRPPSSEAEAEPGTQLYQRLFLSLQPHLGDTTLLFLAPDGNLALLPFEVLPMGNGARLIDRFRISYVATGRNLLRFAQMPNGKGGPCVVAADPAFDLAHPDILRADPAVAESQPNWHSMTLEITPGPGPSRMQLSSLEASQLPGTAYEGRRIAQRLGVIPLLGNGVTKGDVLRLRSPRILHLATHGFFIDPDAHSANRKPNELSSPLLCSGLILAGFNTWRKGGLSAPGAGNGLLTAEEVLGMDLHCTELVVLSACETGVGQVHPGEGVLGLRWAFVVAGARTLVMSLWKVPDLATAVLMDRFYHNLLDQNMARDQALREAQQYMRGCTVGQLRQAGWLGNDSAQHLAGLADADLPFADPHYWGAFICQGDPSPLPESSFPRAGARPVQPEVSPGLEKKVVTLVAGCP